MNKINIFKEGGVLERKTMDNLDLKERLQFIHENELIAILGMVANGAYDELEDRSKKTIRLRLWNLKICLGYMVDDYLKENIEESE